MSRSTFNIAICGSRTITDYNLIHRAISEAVWMGITTPTHLVTYQIVSGGAKGVDTLAMKYASDNKLNLIEIKPDYNTYTWNIAPLMRNVKIAETADVLIAIHDGKSTGTLHMISCMKKLNKGVHVLTIPC